MQATLNNETVTVRGEGLIFTLTYPSTSQATTAYSFIWECCERFSKEDRTSPGGETPKIYVFGELYKPLQFMNRISDTAPKLGVKVNIVSEESRV